MILNLDTKEGRNALKKQCETQRVMAFPDMILALIQVCEGFEAEIEKLEDRIQELDWVVDRAESEALYWEDEARLLKPD